MKRTQFVFELLSTVDINFAKLVVAQPKFLALIDTAFTTKDESPDDNYECLEFIGDKIVNLIVVRIAEWKSPKQGTDAVQHLSSKNIQPVLSDALNLFDLLSLPVRSRMHADKKVRVDIFESLFGLLDTIIQEVVFGVNPDFTVIHLNSHLIVNLLRFPQELAKELYHATQTSLKTTTNHKRLLLEIVGKFGYDAASSNVKLQSRVERDQRVYILALVSDVVEDINKARPKGFKTLQEAALSATVVREHTELRLVELETEDATIAKLFADVGMMDIIERLDMFDMKGHIASLTETDANTTMFKTQIERVAACKISVRFDPNVDDSGERIVFAGKSFPSNAEIFVRFKKDRRSGAFNITYPMKSIPKSITSFDDRKFVGSVCLKLKGILEAEN